MSPRDGSRGKPHDRARIRRRFRNRLALLVATAALAASSAAILISRSRGPAAREDVKPLEPAPLHAISWPAVRPEAAGSFREARLGLERALSLYASGEREAADALILSSLGDLERCGALVPALGAHHYQTVLTAAGKASFPEAEKRASRWLEKYPEDFDHLFLLGQVRYQMRKWPQAAESFRAAAAIRPRSAEVLRWLSQTSAQMGAQEEGVRAVKRSLEAIRFPAGDYGNHPLARTVLGNAIAVLHRFQEYELLAEVAGAYRGKFGDAGEAAMAEGVALANIGRYGEAEPLLRKASGDPANVENADEIDLSLGLALSKQSKWAEAARVLAALLERNPFHGKACYQLGMSLTRLGKHAEAEAMIAKSRELAPSEREMRRERELRSAGYPGRAVATASAGYASRGELGRAEQILRAPELRADPNAVFALADLYLDLLRVSDAERVLEHAATLMNPTHLEILGRQALALCLRGEREKGIAALRQAAATATTDPYWSVELAKTLLEDERFAEAVTVLEPLRRGDADREASFLLAQALLGEGDPDRALDLLRSISTGDTRWNEWEGEAWLALALLRSTREARPASIEEAARLLDAAPAHARSSRVFLRTRVLLAERRSDAAGDAATAREALQRHEAAQPGIVALERRIASAPWPDAGVLHLALARIHASRGDTRRAVRHARIALQARPDSLDALRVLEAWLEGDANVFFRLRVLRDLARLAPDDGAVRERIQAIETRWLRLE